MVEAEVRGWLPAAGVMLSESQFAAIFDGAEKSLAAYVTADGSVRFDAPAHIVTARKALAATSS
jgi:hypothetical protein